MIAPHLTTSLVIKAQVCLAVPWKFWSGGNYVAMAPDNGLVPKISERGRISQNKVNAKTIF